MRRRCIIERGEPAMSAVGAYAPAGDRTESRNFLRARCEMNGNGRDCRILNLTADGVFVESYVPPVTGSKVTLSFRLPNGHQVCTAGVVRDHRFQVGFSVEFVDLPPHDSDQITGIVG
jgi:hypothetical protein